MNRRKILGMLPAAVTAPLAAETIDIGEIRGDGERYPVCMPVAINHQRKCYSKWSYDTLIDAYYKHRQSEFFKELASGSGTSSGVTVTISSSGLALYNVYIRHDFADDCLNGEMPGVWWE